MEAQHSVLVERAQGIYSFSHLTFQEYLTARYLAENQGRGVINKLIRNHLTDRRWREVFLLTASLLDDADEFITAIRHAIDGVITDTPALIRLLTWAHDRTKQANTPLEQHTAVHMAYIFLAGTRSRELAREQAIDLALELRQALATTFARVQAFARDLARSREIARSSERSLIRVLASEITNDLVRAREITRDLACETTSLVGFDYGLYYTWVYATLFAAERLDPSNKNWRVAIQQFPSLVENTIALASEAGLHNLAQKLATWPSFLPNISAQNCQQYADALFIIMRDERDLGREWNLSDEENNKLRDYFYTNELLVQCLKVAAVSDRQAVLNGLLLPPGVGKPAK